MRFLHSGTFTLQSVAYGANDGQKMLAVFVAMGVSSGSGLRETGIVDLLLIGGCFAIGTLIGMRRYARTLGLGVLLVRPLNAVVAESSSAAVVLATALAGSPVSTTQSLVGGLIGSGLHEGYRRIRWASAMSIFAAWVYTFPLTFAIGVAASRLFILT